MVGKYEAQALQIGDGVRLMASRNKVQGVIVIVSQTWVAVQWTLQQRYDMIEHTSPLWRFIEVAK